MRSTSAPASFRIDKKKTDIDEEIYIIESLPLEEQVMPNEQQRQSPQVLSSTLMTSTAATSILTTVTKNKHSIINEDEDDENEKRNVSNTSTLSSIM